MASSLRLLFVSSVFSVILSCAGSAILANEVAAADQDAINRRHEALLTRWLQDAAQDKSPGDYFWVTSGKMDVLFHRTESGVALTALFDLEADEQLAAAKQPPFFQVDLCPVRGETPKESVDEKKEEKADAAKVELPKLVADHGWTKVDVQPNDDGVTIRFEKPEDPRLVGLAVTLQAKLQPKNDRIAWTIDVENLSDEWSLSSVVFPQISLADQGETMSLLVPHGSGILIPNPCQRDSYWYRFLYPNGWCTMAFEAVYSLEKNTGFYWAMHDPRGHMKYVFTKLNPAEDTLLLQFEHPVPDLGTKGVDFHLPGEAVWQWFRGDWYDASMIYRDWARAHAEWYPQLTDEGREDTPLWFRESPAWARIRGGPEKIVPAMKRFHEYLGVPAAVHWYDWHQIPYDNDYPHYFPAVDGFVEGVAELKASGVRVMPYINGRLWDTRDREDQDYQFTSIALAAAAKQESGKPFIETYNSKEKDGSKVELAPMCPSTKLWQEKVAELVDRHIRENDVDGVYIDQIGAASPHPCVDPTHSHPLGGGCWWNEGYWKMLDAIRAAKPSDRILTTECNAEPFLRWFDGYLSWHWQENGQVPAFSAVYGGTVQLFGRCFYDESWKGIAMRMKVGQQLGFGEQIGWIDPRVVDEPEDGPFFRQVVHLRYAFSRYFYAGEMVRPPKTGPVPTVTADWRWFGEKLVTTPVVMTGAWRLPKENRTVIFLVNISDEPITTTVTFDPAEYGWDTAKPLQATVRTDLGDEGKGETLTIEGGTHRVTLPARSAQAWELR